MEGFVTDIQHFSVHDGPGIRTTVFLKGCNMRCFWCHNPETLNPGPEIQLFPDKCIGCGECINVCPNNAHVIENGVKIFKRELCTACGRCASSCYAESLVLVGKKMTAEEVLEDVLEDKDFYDSSNGGVTISGGDPFYQDKFTYEILKLCKDKGIHTAIETNMAWPWERIKSLLDLIDLIMMDIKVMNDEIHKSVTGISNKMILDNAKKLSRLSKPIIIRTPVVPGVNDTPDQIKDIAHFVSSLHSVVYYELLSYHPLGIAKYHSLGIECKSEGIKRPENGKMRQLGKVASEFNIEVLVDNRK